MPYILPKRRPPILRGKKQPECGGDLNYKLAKLMLNFRDEVGESYETYNRIGAAYRATARNYDAYRMNLVVRRDEAPGSLTQVLTTAIHEFLQFHNFTEKAHEDVDGTLANCYEEFYNRYIARYEKKARRRNGDI